MASYSESYQLKLIFFKDTVFLEKNNNTWYREIVKKILIYSDTLPVLNRL